MSYREENGQVVLTISRDDYENLLIHLGIAAGYFSRAHGDLFAQSCALLNRLNQGNPHYIPYAVEPEEP